MNLEQSTISELAQHAESLGVDLDAAAEIALNNSTALGDMQFGSALELSRAEDQIIDAIDSIAVDLDSQQKSAAALRLTKASNEASLMFSSDSTVLLLDALGVSMSDAEAATRRLETWAKLGKLPEGVG